MPPLVFEILVALQPLVWTNTSFLPKGNLREKPHTELWARGSSVSSIFLGLKAKTSQNLRRHGLSQL